MDFPLVVYAGGVAASLMAMESVADSGWMAISEVFASGTSRAGGEVGLSIGCTSQLSLLL
jgi:hypothetical protein